MTYGMLISLTKLNATSATTGRTTKGSGGMKSRVKFTVMYIYLFIYLFIYLSVRLVYAGNDVTRPRAGGLMV